MAKTLRFLIVQFPSISLLGLILIGFISTLLPAIGFLPVLGRDSFSTFAITALIEWPGISKALYFSFMPAFASTLLSFLLACWICALVQLSPFGARIQRLFVPLLAIPHAPIAIGFLFLFASNGWFMRLFGIGASIDAPLDVAIVPDFYGLALTFGLMLRETPWLVVMLFVLSAHTPVAQLLNIARSLGYSRLTGWVLCVLPIIYPKLRFPVLAVLVYGLSVADMGLILLPTTNSNLAILIIKWFQDPDLNYQFIAAAGAILQTLLVFVGIGVWYIGERLGAALGKHYAQLGPPRSIDMRPIEAHSTAHKAQKKTKSSRLPYHIKGTISAFAILIIGWAGLGVMGVWSVAHRWRFPDLLPETYSLKRWERFFSSQAELLVDSFFIGLIAAFLGLVFIVYTLQMNPPRWLKNSLYLPIIIPQPGFLFGIQTLFAYLYINGSWATVIFVHLFFVVPYMLLIIQDSWERFDPRWIRMGQSFGLSSWAILWRIRLPLMTKTLLMAFAIGFAVSIALYLPTIFAGGGRVETLAMATLSALSRGDNRTVALYGFTQALLPFIFFYLALIIPAFVFRNRRGMH